MTWSAWVIVVAVGVVGGACSKKKDEAPAATAAPADPAATSKSFEDPTRFKAPPRGPEVSPNEVTIEVSGGLTATLTGRGGDCSLRDGGPDPGSSWSVRSEEINKDDQTFEFVVRVNKEAFEKPTFILNVRGAGRRSYMGGRKRGPNDKVELARDATSAVFDVTLSNIEKASDTVRVKGSIRCPKPMLTKCGPTGGCTTARAGSPVFDKPSQ